MPDEDWRLEKNGHGVVGACRLRALHPGSLFQKCRNDHGTHYLIQRAEVSCSNVSGWLGQLMYVKTRPDVSEWA